MPGLITPMEVIFILEERLANARTEKEKKKLYIMLEEMYDLNLPEREIEYYSKFWPGYGEDTLSLL